MYHRLVQVSLCEYQAFNDGYTCDLEGNFTRIVAPSAIESTVSKVTIALAESPPAEKKDISAIAAASDGSVLCMKKKFSYIIKEVKVENVEVHRLEQALLDAVGVAAASVLPKIIAELKDASVVVGYNIAYHLAVLRSEASLLSLEFPEVKTICLSTICRELSANPSMSREQMSNIYGEYACNEFAETAANCFTAANIFFKMIMRRQLNMI